MDFNQLEAFLTAQTKKQGGVSAEQAAVLSKFWKNHKSKIRESLISQSRWDNSLRNVSWRVDLKTQSRHADQVSAAVGVVELELGKTGKLSELEDTLKAGHDTVLSKNFRASQLLYGRRVLSSFEALSSPGGESEFICLEFDEAKVNHVLKKMCEIEESISAITHNS
ncbi:COMM domain-containing protein 1 [Acipenser ruthenus]|uniref:COMM domain-containing protein 1 n=1 Tax=Acipenser ruthenus TaxID=7906 RepID=A0A444U1D5_ACIRT|nr:COMM domain-containing protein 1 [Acipenser ruthenus]